MPHWDKFGAKHACTLLHIDEAQVIQVKIESNNGHTSIQVGAGAKKSSRLTKPLEGHFKKYGVPPKQKIIEFPVSPSNVLAPGTKLYAQHFVAGQLVDVCSISKGKGFQGGIKRWNFKGLPASHGVSAAHRSLGSTGHSTVHTIIY